MKISVEKWEKLSDEMVKITRQFNEEDGWKKHWTTSGWRSMSDEALLKLLTILKIEVRDGEDNS